MVCLRERCEDLCTLYLQYNIHSAVRQRPISSDIFLMQNENKKERQLFAERK